MPIYEVIKRLTFTEEEKELINGIIKLAESIDADFCDNACCKDCPFEKFCIYEYNADKVEAQMNRIVRD